MKMFGNKLKAQDKFALVVFALIILLAVNAFYFLYMRSRPIGGPSIEGTTRSELQMLSKGVEAYRLKHGEWPPEGSACFDALREMSEHEFNTKDPWDHPYHAQRLGFNLFELRSAGPDGQLATQDDVAIVCKAESASD